MKWSEVRRIAERNGWLLVRFESRHDIYEKERETLIIERHSSTELKGRVYHKIRKQLDIK